MAVVRWISVLAGVLRSARRLEGASSSRTTRLSALVLGGCAVGVAVLGWAVPDFAEEEVQNAVYLGLLAVVGVLGQRMAAYRERQIPAEAAQVMLVGVRKKDDKAWRAHHGTVLDANVEGWDYGFNEDGYVWDVKKFVCTGETVRRPKGTPEERNASVAWAVSKLKKGSGQ